MFRNLNSKPRSGVQVMQDVIVYAQEVEMTERFEAEMKTHVFRADIACRKCGGTGLYSGMAEREGTAVECYGCKGSGCESFVLEYEPFVSRKVRSGVTRVWSTNPGIVTAPEVVDGGVSYEDWWEDRESARVAGAEMRNHTCPTWWYQSAEYSLKPKWPECNENWGRPIYECKHFPDKDRCWERWDRENPERQVS